MCVYHRLCSIMFCNLCTEHFTNNVEREQRDDDNEEGIFFFDWLKVLSGTSNQNLSLRFSPSKTSQHIATGNCTDILCWLKFTRSDNHHTAVQRRHYYTLKVFPNCENWLLNFIFPNNTKKGIKFWENWRFRL